MYELNRLGKCPRNNKLVPTSFDCENCDFYNGKKWKDEEGEGFDYVSCGFNKIASQSESHALQILEKLPQLSRHEECPKDKNIKPSSHDCQECDFCKGFKRQENQILSGLSWQYKFIEYFVFCSFKNKNIDKKFIKEKIPEDMSKVLKNEIKIFESKITDAEKSIEKLKDRCEYYLEMICEMKSFMQNGEKDGWL